MAPPPGTPRWGAAYRDFLAKYFTRYAAIVAQTENLPYADQTIDLDPNVRDAWGLPAPRLTYDWRRPNELARIEFMQTKMEEIGRAMGAAQVWRAPVSRPGAPGAHHEGGTRMGSDPKTSVVNRYGQSWDIPNLFVIGSSTFPTMSGFNPTLTIQALAYMSADAIVEPLQEESRPAGIDDGHLPAAWEADTVDSLSHRATRPCRTGRGFAISRLPANALLGCNVCNGSMCGGPAPPTHASAPPSVAY